MENKHIDENLYNEKSLYLLNIRELRDIGRKFGVPSPTTMKKKDLVDYILKIVYGELCPPIRNACGRPNSREFDMNKYIDKIKKNSSQVELLKEIRLNNNIDSGLVFKLAAPKDEYFVGEIEQRVVFREGKNCYLRKRQFIKSEDDEKIDCQIADNLKLENFDVIEVIFSQIGMKIVSINGEKIANKIKTFEVGKHKIGAGFSKVFHLRTKEERENLNLEIKNSCNNLGLQLITFGLEEYNGSCIKNFLLDVSENYNNQYKQFITFIEYCKKLIYENKDFIMLIQDMKLIDNILDSFDDDVVDRIKSHLNEDLNDIVKLGNVLIGFNFAKKSSY